MAQTVEDVVLDQTVFDLITRLTNASAATLLIVALIGGFRGWYVFGWTFKYVVNLLEKRYEDKSKECEQITKQMEAWKAVATKTASIAESAVPVAIAGKS